MPMAELITGFFLIVGAIFLLVGSIGLFRLPDFYMRLHGPTKASTLGIGAILMASIVFFSFRGGGISINQGVPDHFVHFFIGPDHRKHAGKGRPARQKKAPRRYVEP
jgi:monovalent cation/proton antiporter MnhG/PhaG subunit